MAERILVDFHNADPHGRLRLNCVGTVEDLAQQQVELREGMLLTLDADDLDDDGQLDELLVDGIVTFSEEEHCWVAAIDWTAIHHESDRGEYKTWLGLGGAKSHQIRNTSGS